ncbi:hypothetical protein CF65_01176 [Aggregatibacter actinomycetemcomitans HK1651]|nr:hypothetical protein CF65_01176 [Aggregatibacter actinomycetemcomitans HK1651]
MIFNLIIFTIKELHLNWLVVVSNFWGADQSAVDLQDVFTHYTS